MLINLLEGLKINLQLITSKEGCQRSTVTSMCISDLNMFEDNQATLIRKISGTKITVTRDRENVTGIDGEIFTVQIIRRLRNISERKIVS